MSNPRYSMSIVREWMRRSPFPVLDFALGESHPQPPSAIVELIRSQPEMMLRKASRTELGQFKTVAAEMLERVYGVAIAPDGILPVPGGRAAINALVSWAIEPGDAVLVTEPTYPVFSRIARQRQATVCPVVLNPQREFLPDFRLSPPQALSIRIAALNYPNNPTGTILSAATLQGLGNLLESNALIFNDATYGPLTYNGAPKSILADDLGERLDQRVIELHSLSKMFGLGPTSVAFLAGESALIQELNTYCDFIWSPLTSLEVAIAAHCLSDSKSLEERCLEIGGKVAELRGTLQELGFQPYATEAGAYVLCPLGTGPLGQPNFDPWEAAKSLLDFWGLAVMPWGDARRGYLRFSSFYREEELHTLAHLNQHSGDQRHRRFDVL